MGSVLAKMPQQRIRAPQNHPTIEKLEQLFDYMDDLGLDIRVDFDRIYVKDTDREDGEWEIRDLINSEYLSELPCHVDEYKLTQTVDISPREAQPAPETPVATPASGLNHFKAKPKKVVVGNRKNAKKGKKVLAPAQQMQQNLVDPRVTMVPKAVVRGKK